MDQVDHRLGVRYPAGLLNKKLLNINLLNTKPPGTTGGSFCRDAPTGNSCLIRCVLFHPLGMLGLVLAEDHEVV